MDVMGDIGIPVSGIDALWYTRSDADGVVMEGTFPGFMRCICVFLQRPQDDESI